MLYSAYSDVCQLNSFNSNVKLTLILAYSKGLWTAETWHLMCPTGHRSADVQIPLGL